MPQHEIEIEVVGEGEIQAEVKGIVGIACENISKWLDGLGKVVSHTRTKDAYKQSPQKTQGIRQ